MRATPTTATGVERFAAAYPAFAGNGASHDPAWLQTIRADAIATFQRTGFPTSRQESWRFTNVAPIERTAFEPARAVDVDATTIESLAFGDDAWYRLVFVNGAHVPSLSSAGDVPNGVRLGSIREILESDPTLMEAHLAKYAGIEKHPFAALNTAFLADGAFLYVPDGVSIERPIELMFLTITSDAPTVSYPRTLVVLGAQASATVIENYLGRTEDPYFTNAVTEYVLGPNAHLESSRLQREGGSAYHVATTRVHQARDAQLASTVVAFGGVLSRHDITAVLDGEGAHASLNGLYVLDGSQHTDHHTVVDHAKPHCTSHELFNGILDDRARSVFTGTLQVRPHAQKTDAKQTNNNMLLSDTARANSQTVRSLRNRGMRPPTSGWRRSGMT